MAKAVLLVFTRPSRPEVEDEYNRWYDEEHLADVLRVPGIAGASRFKISNAQRTGFDPADAPAPYLAVYEIESDDLQATLDELRSRGRTSEMPISDALGSTADATPVVMLYEVI